MFVVAILTSIINGIATVIISLISGVIAVAFHAGPSPSGPGSTPAAALLIQGLLNSVVQTVIAPITTLPMVLLYFDVRVRKEGYDVELLAQEMGEGSAGSGPYASPA